jgi:hypothetical protein
MVCISTETLRQTETQKCENNKRNHKDRVGCLHQLRTPTVVEKSDEGAVKDDISLPVVCDESNTGRPLSGRAGLIQGRIPFRMFRSDYWVRFWHAALDDVSDLPIREAAVCRAII